MLEKEVFHELNTFAEDGGPTPDLIADMRPPSPTPSPWQQLFGSCCRACNNKVPLNGAVLLVL